MVIDRPFDSYQIGESFTSRARTITESDLVLFSAITGDWYPLHTDVEYAKKTPFGQRIAHGMLVLSVASGLSRLEPGWLVAFYGMDEVRFLNPTFIGDTIHVEAEVIDKQDKGSVGGILTFQLKIRKQTGEIVASGKVKLLVSKG